MKIIQLIFSLQSGGAEKFVVDLSNQLSMMGHDVTVCMLRKDDNKESTFNKQFLRKEVRFISMEFESGFSMKMIHSLKLFILEQKPDVVHCHLNVIPFIFNLAFSHKEIVYVHTLHSVTSKASGSRFQKLINKLFYSTNKIIPVCISKLCKSSYVEYYGLNNAYVIQNGRSEITKSSLFQDVEKEISNYKTSSNTKIFIHVARCSKEKNQELLIRTFNRMNQNNIDFILLILGSSYDSPLGQTLKKMSCDKIHFIGEKSNVGDYLYCSDAFCLTSHYEGLPITLLEALSCGVTPICTPVGGIPDVIVDGRYGYLSKGIDEDSYFDAVRRFLVRPLNKENLIDYYRDNYSIIKCAREYEKLFCSLSLRHD